MKSDESIFERVAAEVAARAGSDESTHGLAELFVGLELFDDSGRDYSSEFPDIPKAILEHRVPLLFSANADRSLDWPSANLSVGALAAISGYPFPLADKSFYGMSLCQLEGRRRLKVNVRGITGLPFDDDGVIGRVDDPTCPVSPDGYVVIEYATASDGKNSTVISASAYEKFASANRLALTPTDNAAARYLNLACEYGPAYRNVKLERSAIGRCVPVMIDGRLVYAASFEPQQRTRRVAPFSRPLAGPMLERFKDEPELFELFCRRSELKIFGINGCDPATLRIGSVAYLPSGPKPNQFFRLSGHQLFDPYPIAEAVLAENPPRERLEVKVGGTVSPEDLKTLRGVLLASLISDRYPELASNNSTAPLVLRRCPFAEEHGSKTGQSDRSAYVYDPDPEAGYAYPYVGCHHQTCKRRKTDEFVAEMIRLGDLAKEDAFSDPDYRLALQKPSSPNSEA